MSLKAENISKLYGTQKALNNVSFEIKTGEIVGFLGPNGAGKSTMMKIITGYINQSGGKITVNELNLAEKQQEIRQQIGYLPEHNPLYLDMYVKEYLQFTAHLYKIKNVKQRTEEIIKMTGLGLEKHKKLSALSKGYRQRVGIGAALIHDPAVLILDEPTTGLDPNQIIEVRNLIAKAGENKTVMLSTHIMQEVEAICNRVIIIDKGIIVADRATEKVAELSTENFITIEIELDKVTNKDELLKIPLVTATAKINDKHWVLNTKKEKDARPEIFKWAVANNFVLLAMQKKEKNMESIFRELTGKQ